ncbi:MAG: L-alanine-DL-glutamate epimerase-like enolase superfamily enzyme [Saprospiraceae bacterium]|jgi:L-alanine-DL-glutamate epimerase-like enolase superfamily enzyme
MKIIRISYERLDLKLRKPYVIAYETVSFATNFILKLETDIGLVGYGCAAPDVPVTGETPEMVATAITDVIEPYLRGQNPFTYSKIVEDLKPLLNGKSSALAMVDMALLDLTAKKADVPLYQFLGGYRQKISTSVTIGICDLQETLAEAEEFVKQGFWILKIKGGLNLEEDIERVLRVKERFPKSILRFDGNQGYTAAEAICFAEATDIADIQIFEQPLDVNKEGKMREVAEETDIPVMVDESLKTLADSFRLVRHDRTDMVNIKIMKVGGILEGMHINSVAKAAKKEVMVGCIDECALGISAGLHFALSRLNIHFADLDGHLDFSNDPFKGLFHLEDGWLEPTEQPGLGLTGF